VHTFYEAVGMMISAQTDPTAQEHLLEKYMALPNQVWDSIISQATQVTTLHCSSVSLPGVVSGYLLVLIML